MRLGQHLTFSGDCEAAFELYARCLRGRVLGVRRYAESPLAAHVPPDWQQKILFASLEVGGVELHGSDHVPSHYQQPRGFYVALHIQTPEEAERVFRELSPGGKVQVDLQKTFWSTHFALLIDRFGTPWEIDHEVPA